MEQRAVFGGDNIRGRKWVARGYVLRDNILYKIKYFTMAARKQAYSRERKKIEVHIFSPCVKRERVRVLWLCHGPGKSFEKFVKKVAI